ncbi:MAG: homocysteine S-methyltransferase family protein [Desulfuromonadaceae bacterium]|nr:homocysteine S-methyltransferase family protein [Desulfuromonadaceae bacterium]MDD2849143.1 homocysteine S-methyltransferase family protein [Desulfuromonadaceae bacterium]MDD4129511.1 homocysteine S-methyltransferase family protein [Desulfuromonadaceae bacterium]
MLTTECCSISEPMKEPIRHNTFLQLLETSATILGEGAVIERLRRMPGICLDEHVVNSALIYDEAGRSALETICRQYLEIGRTYDLPLLLSTPTWRAAQEHIAAAGLSGRDLNGDNFRFLDALRREYGSYGSKVIICGLMSCRGDAYKAAEALTTAEARTFHAWQAEALASSGVDLLLASTLPALSEAIGLAQALAATGLPYLISFVARPEGTLLDGTPLKDAISAIDNQTSPQPLAYLINCTHASNFRRAMFNEQNSSALVRKRVIGLLANTAALSPEELDNSSVLVEEEPELFAADVAALQKELGLRIVGGCCGTDERHIDRLARRLVESKT